MRAAPGAVPPSPTAVVRLLAVADAAVLVVPRPDGGGLDLPTARVEGQDATGALRGLLAEHGVGVAEPVPVGWVRNHVPDPPVDYPWPSPEAFFVVHRVDLASRSGGTWLPLGEAAEALGHRHWWPLVGG
ncbi:hypothetical protein [Nocardioides bruguierae]|uniref:Uncharacterized protein n=1 Tax=Nocardioides bruguierae TaxID=2945102 RepID=A0A9X2D807_9ACTN|nr:hypothetical protein [Nocardioides bruguierae]MCM0621045.1 hypothetical protein [Nocardioides bruguierae]